jgi:hypothetical protein
MRQSHPAPLSFSLGLVRGVCAGYYQSLLPAGPSRRYHCESFLGCLGPYHGGTWSAFACFFLHVIGLPPNAREVGLTASTRQNDFLTDRFFGTAAISLCSSPPSLLASQIVPTAATVRRRAAEAFISEQNLLRFLPRHRTC